MIDRLDPSRHFVLSRLTWNPRSHALTICQLNSISSEDGQVKGGRTYRHILIGDIEHHLLLLSKYNLLRIHRFQRHRDIDHML
jgi:hypothetical protein